MNKDESIQLTPARLGTFIFYLRRQRIRPTAVTMVRPSQRAKKDCNVPFDSTLLPASTTTHTLTHGTPEDIIVNILALQDSQLGDNFREFFLFFLRPMATPSDFLSFKVVAPSVTTI